MSREEKREQHFTLVNQWAESGMSQVEFAGSNNIKLTTLRYWITKSRQAGASGSSFIQLNNPGGTPICLRYPNGVELLLPVHTPVGLIKGLIHL